MKTKIFRNLTLGLGCLALTFTLSSNLSQHNYSNKSSNTIKLMEESPYGMIQSKHTIKPMEESPYGMIQSSHIIRSMQG